MKITVIIDSTPAVDKLRKLVDSGRFTEAQKMSSMFDGFAEQVKSLLQTKGGHANIMLYERQVLELVDSAVEDLYTILEGYRHVMGKDVSVGIGLNFDEARRACEKSRTSKDIEFYEPGTHSEQVKRNEIDDDQEDLELSPNLGDVQKPDPPKATKKSKEVADKKVVLRPSFEEESAEEQQAQQQQQMQAQAEPQQAEAQQQQEQPQQDPREQQVQQALRGQTQKEEIEPDGKTELDPQTAEPAQAQPEDKRAEKLVALLANVKGHLPDIMKLHDTNPEAFKQAMGMIAKLTSIAKSEDGRSALSAYLNKKKVKTILHQSINHPAEQDDFGYDYFGNKLNTPNLITKTEITNSEDLTKSTKDMKQMLGPVLTPEHKEHIDWAKNLPNSNWQMWATRQYKKDPKSLTPEVKQKIEHFAGSQHIPDIAKLRFEKEHDLNSGLNMLSTAEKNYGESLKNNKNLVTPTLKTKKLVEVPGEKEHWFGLGQGACSAEGKAMGHCGNVPSKVEGDKVISLRTPYNINGKEYHEPHLTFISNGGHLGEMKGRGNEKPAKHYHKHIVELLKDPRIKSVLGGGYLHENNFQFSDLSPAHQAEVLNSNPNLITDTESPENITKILNIPSRDGDKISSVRREIASNPNLSPEHQAKLVNDPNYSIRVDLASNPNLSPEHHAKLVNDPNYGVRREIASNPNLSPEHHARLAQDPDESVRREIAKNPNLSPEHQARLAQDPDADVRGEIASNPNLSPEHHARLAQDPETYVRREIASNPNLSPEHQARLAQDPDTYVRHNLARNPNLSPEHHARLAQDPKADVRHSLASKPNLSPEHQAKLVNDPDTYVRREIASNPNLSPEHHAKLVNDPDESVRRGIASNPNLSPEHHAKLVNDPDTYVRSGIARNPNLSPEHHARLAQDPKADVRHSLASKPNLSPEHQAKLVNDPDTYVRRNLASNPNLSPEHQAKLVNDPNYSIRVDLASNPNLSPEHHAKLVNDPNYGVRREIASNPNLSPEHHARLAQDPDESVRRGIASNPNLSPEHQARLAQDPDADVRRNLASNPNLSPEHQARLAQDPDADVRQIIQDNLQSKVKKSEDGRELIKALGRPKITWPIGTVLGRKKKVANGRWRSLGAGQVQDGDGNAISVKAHNSKADDPGQPKI